jgi:hypothetical protein
MFYLKRQQDLLGLVAKNLDKLFTKVTNIAK